MNFWSIENSIIFLGNLVMMFSMQKKCETMKVSIFLDAKKLALLINKYMFYDFCRIIYISYDHETFCVTVLY